MKRLFTALERRTIKVKLLLGLVSLLAISFGIGLVSLYNLRTLNHKLQLLHDVGMLGIANIKDLQINYMLIGRTLRQAILAPDASGRELALKQLSQTRSQIPKTLEELRPRVAFAENQKILVFFEDQSSAYSYEVDKALALIAGGRIGEAQALVATADFQKSGIAANEALSKLVQAKEESAKALAQESRNDAIASIWLTVLIIGGGLLLGLLQGVLVNRSIRQPLDRLRGAVDHLAAGKLDQAIPHADYPNELGDLARAIEVLRAEARQMVTQRWIKTNIAEISSDLQL
ncbi:MAG: MCP four helix bundle domain-containing protein, partial [Deltaproteobacteria bacterium]|nr:MCP four helix bundle domain-containing protein [Deltaproteobacteria bacterium]